jgi:small subunit ribosomal protein S15e
MADKGKKGDKGGKDKAPKGGEKEKGGEKKEEKKDDKKAAEKAPKGDKPAKGDKAEKGAPAAKGDKAAPAAATGDKKEKKEEKKTEKKAPAAPASAETGGAATDEANEEGGEGGPRKRGPFRRFYYRGHEVPTLLDLSHAELMKLMTARARRRFARGHVPMNLIRRLRKAKKDAPEGDKPKTVKTHLRNMIIVPEMVASVVGVYNGQTFTQVEIKPDMIGHYLGEFSISYKPVKHGRPGVGATNSSRFIPLK